MNKITNTSLTTKEEKTETPEDEGHAVEASATQVDNDIQI